MARVASGIDRLEGAVGAAPHSCNPRSCNPRWRGRTVHCVVRHRRVRHCRSPVPSENLSISGTAQWWEQWAVGGGDITGALKPGTGGSCCALIATVHRPGGVRPRSSARRCTERWRLRRAVGGDIAGALTLGTGASSDRHRRVFPQVQRPPAHRWGSFGRNPKALQHNVAIGARRARARRRRARPPRRRHQRRWCRG